LSTFGVVGTHSVDRIQDQVVAEDDVHRFGEIVEFVEIRMPRPRMPRVVRL